MFEDEELETWKMSLVSSSRKVGVASWEHCFEFGHDVAKALTRAVRGVH